jgi:hypothetical protein
MEDLEREFEERVESTRRRPPSRGGSPEHQKRGKDRPKAPLLLRVLAWCGVILLCFVVGYIGTSYMLKLLEKQIFFKPEGRGRNQEALEVFLSGDNAADVRLDMQKTTLSLFYPKDDTLVEEKADVIARTREDNIQDAVLRLLSLSGLFDSGVSVKHVFRNADTVYLDFSGAFVSALSAAGARSSTLFITGIVRTMRDNFPPVTKVRFLVDSKIASTGSPVDLTAVWQLSR